MLPTLVGLLLQGYADFGWGAEAGFGTAFPVWVIIGGFMDIKFTRWITIPLCLTLVIGGVSAAWAAGSSNPAAATKSNSTPGVELAKTISLVTGVAISPLLGVGAVGAYEYYHAAPAKRPNLPWFAQPWFWIPALLLVALVGAKDVLGTATPTALKKPFDFAEAVESKISALVAAGAFIPLVISVFPNASAGQGSLAPASLGFAAINGAAIGNALLVPFAIAVFFVVWLASHAINMLILISPFTTVDAALKGFRMALLGLITGVSFASPYVGAILSVVVVVASYFIAGWSFRLMIFGSVYMWDTVTFRRKRYQPGAEYNWVFTARKLEGAPIRTYGKLMHRPDGALKFVFKPWLFLPQKEFVLPPRERYVGRGLLYSEIGETSDTRNVPLFILPPRHSTHEEAVARVYGIASVRDTGILHGLKAAWKWLRSNLNPQPPAGTVAPPPTVAT